jgi:P-type Mg2+ transporter
MDEMQAVTDHGGTSNTYWCQPAEELLAALNAKREGLTTPEAQARLKQVGPNSLATKEKATPLRLFLNQLNSPIIYILLFATLVSAVLQDWADAVIILVIIFGSAGLSFFQEYSASNAAEKLKARVSLKTTVLRDGQPVPVPVEEVVPGDIVQLSAGSLIPADGILLEANDFFVNQSVLTGETFPVEKQPGTVAVSAGLPDRTNNVFMGTNVTSGSGLALMVTTGKATNFGQIAEKLSLSAPETEFERGIRHFGYLLSEVTLIMVLAVFAINVFFQKPVLDSFLFSLALAVGLTPQLLPAIININLSRGSQAMAARGVIVRRLASIENFGSMDILCTDKTGTLTLGVVKLDGAMDIHGQPSDGLLRLAFINAHLQTGMANALDDAIQGAIQAGTPAADISQVVKIDEIPYDFTRKRLSVVVDLNGPDVAGGGLMITKGAFERVLEACSHVVDIALGSPDAGDQARLMTAEDRQALVDLYQKWSGQGYRVLGVAQKTLELLEVYPRTSETEMAFCGFLLFFDPPKPGVKEAIRALEDDGLSLKIITGDNKLVAMHTAQEVGLPVESVITGGELNQLRDEALWQAAEHTTLFVEVDPNQKERIIMALRRTGHVVGYMGDGINDAPSLHAADVGISVDTAVDVAKEAADFVLLEQNLSVLHDGIEQGRRTFTNTLKYVFMATSANFGNMFSVAGASLLLPFLPMLPKQILLINFLTDLPEMSIAGDNVDAVTVRKPRRWDIGFIRRFMVVFGLLSSLFDFATFGVLYWMIRASGQSLVDSARLFHTGWFLESVLSATLVVFAIRTRLPFHHSRPSRVMMTMTGVVIAITLLIPFSPLAGILEFQPVSLLYLAVMLVIVGMYFAFAETAKRIFYRREEKRE